MTRRSFLANMLGAISVMALPRVVKSATTERMKPQKLSGVRFGLDENPPRFDWNPSTKRFDRKTRKLTTAQRNEAYHDAEFHLTAWDLERAYQSLVREGGGVRI